MPKHSSPKNLLAIVAALSMSGIVLAAPTPADSLSKHTTESLARRAVAADKNESANAIAELRAMGPEGLRVFLEANRVEIEAALRAPTGARKGGASAGDSRDHAPSAQGNQVLSAPDSICQQKDRYASKLYWYTVPRKLSRPREHKAPFSRSGCSVD